MTVNAPPAPPGDEDRVVLLPPTTRDGNAISDLLVRAGIACARVSTTTQLCAALGDGGAGAVLISEEALVDGGGLALASLAAAQPVWSDLPLLVLARSGTESPRMAAALAGLGNVSVVERPVRMNTLLSLVRSALRARRRQYEMRAHLAELAEAGRALREGEERYRLLVDNLQDYAIFVSDTDGRVVSWNAGAARTLGYTAAEVLGKSAAIFFTDEDRAAGMPEREMTTARDCGQASDVRWHVRKSGERFFVDGVMTALRDDAGALRGFAKLMRDVTDQRRATEALRKSEERLALAVDSAELGTFYCPVPQGELVWNAKCKEHFWLPPDATVDIDRVHAIIHPDDRGPVRAAVERAVFGNQPFDVECRTVAPDGRHRWVRAKGRAFYDAGDHPKRFDGVTLDISAQKQAEAERERLLASRAGRPRRGRARRAA